MRRTLPVNWAHVSPKLWSPFACSVGDLVARQLPELLPSREAALFMNLSLRSFQRALSKEGLSYQQIQSEVRFRLAGWHLLRPLESRGGSSSQPVPLSREMAHAKLGTSGSMSLRLKATVVGLRCKPQAASFMHRWRERFSRGKRSWSSAAERLI